MAGFTTSPNFPTTPGALQQTLKLGSYIYPQAAFVTKFPLGSVQVLSISSLFPTSGGNAGSVTISIQGGGFHNGASVKLVGASTITGNSPAVGSEGRTITAAFDLTAAPVGLYALVVANPDNTTTSLPNAFTVLQGGGSNIDLSLTGLAVNHGSDTNVVLEAVISNNGKNDGLGGVLFVPNNSGFTFTSTDPQAVMTDSTNGGQVQALRANRAYTPAVEHLDSTNGGQVQAFSSADPTRTLQLGIWPVTHLPSGQSQVVTSTARSGTSSAAACSALWGPVCFTQDVAAVVGCIANAGNACASATAFCTLATACVAAGVTIAPCLPAIRQCLSQSLNPDGTCGPVALQCIQSKSSSCTSSFLPCVHAVDPNALVGPTGIGGQRWVAGGPAMTYIVAFDNEPSAPVPAQQVIVTQPLGANVDLS